MTPVRAHGQERAAAWREDAAASRLRGAGDLAGFVAACREMIRQSPHVALVPDRLGPLVPLVRDAEPESWDWCLRSPEAELAERWFDIVFSSALNGGYFHRDPASGAVVQWEREGSGSAALFAWIRGLHERRLLPCVDQDGLRAEGNHYLEVIGEALEGVPYAEERLRVIAEFALRWKDTAAWLPRVVSPGADGRLVGRLGLREVDLLAADLPAGFGEDPFRKKACLAVLLLTSHLRAHGHDVDAEIPIAADYQIPRGLHWAGAIRISPAFEATLRQGELLDPGSSEVAHFRAAAVVACHELAGRAGRPDWMVDLALFAAFRGAPRFRAESLPAMRIRGMWF